MKRVLCLWLPRWPLQRLYDVRPELRHAPLALCEREPRGALRVLICCVLAAERKIAVGMSAAEATSLAGRRRGTGRGNAGLHLEPYDPRADRQALERLAVECDVFSPLVGLEESPQPESLLLDVTGLDRLFGSEPALAQQVLEHFHRRGLVVRAALADTIGAAWAVAHDCKDFEESADSQHPSPLVGEGGERSEPGEGSAAGPTPHPAHDLEPGAPVRDPPSPTRGEGLFCFPCAELREAASRCWIVPPEQAAAMLGKLPIASLRVAPAIVGWLEALGLSTLAELEPLARDAIAARFGPELLWRWDQACGKAAETIHPCRPAPRWLADWSSETPTDRQDAIEAVLAQHLAKLAPLLAAEDRGIRQLRCTLRDDAGETVSFTVGLVRASLRERHLLELMRLQLERLSMRRPIVGVKLEVSVVGPLESRQQELFVGDAERRDPRQVELLVDRLSSRLGPGAVVRARRWPDAQPEYAWRSAAWLEEPPRTATGTKSRRRVPRALPSRLPELRAQERPLRLAREPVPLELISIVPDGPPIALRLAGREQRIARHWGPERIETGWWRATGTASGSARRDYYRVETASGHRLWLFRRLRDGRWFLHGWFD